jgi:predicted RNA-binding Zn ribbon-like protein
MEALPLHAGEYTGTYKLVGGRPSLDFINTVSWPDSGRAHDWLDSVENLQRWLRAIGLTPTKNDNVELKSVLALREDLAQVLRPLAHGKKPARAAVDTLNRRVERASAQRRIDPGTLGWVWKSPEDAVQSLAPVVLDAADVIASDRARLRYCPSCDWLFEDQTRNGQRRWCDMADCGSRDKARRYYQRMQKN